MCVLRPSDGPWNGTEGIARDLQSHTPTQKHTIHHCTESFPSVRWLLLCILLKTLNVAHQFNSNFCIAEILVAMAVAFVRRRRLFCCCCRRSTTFVNTYLIEEKYGNYLGYSGERTLLCSYWPALDGGATLYLKQYTVARSKQTESRIKLLPLRDGREDSYSSCSQSFASELFYSAKTIIIFFMLTVITI